MSPAQRREQASQTVTQNALTGFLCSGMLLLTYHVTLDMAEAATHTEAVASVPAACAPPLADFQAVDKLLRTPDTATADFLASNTEANNQQPALTDIYDPRMKAAHDAGVTLFTFSLPGSETSRNVLRATESFAAKYGIEVSVRQHDTTVYTDTGPYEEDKPTQEVMDSNLATDNLLRIDAQLSTQPKEYIQAIGLKHIILSETKTRKDKQTLLGDTALGSDTIELDVSHTNSTDSFEHEEGHLADGKACGANEDDPGLTALNPGDIYNPKTAAHKAARTDESFVTSENRLVKSYENGDNTPTARDQEQEVCFADNDDPDPVQAVVTVSSYGLDTGPVEDKADIYRQLVRPTSYDQLFDPRKPVLRVKGRLLLTRLYALAPNVVKYLTGLATHPDTDC